MPCSFQNCESKTYGGKLCPAHQKQKYAGIPLRPLLKKSYSKDAPTRLKEKISITKSGCWEWTAAVNWSGYGRLNFRGELWLAHRLSYTTFVGPIPEGLYVCHKCDNPPCINPKHLFIGTNSDNILDASRKGRMPLHNKPFCVRGHRQIPENKHPSGKCKLCSRARKQEKRERTRQPHSASVSMS